MNANSIIFDSRVRRVRELETALKAERCARAGAEQKLAESLARISEAALALSDARLAAASAPGGVSILIVDGHNLLFARPGANSSEKERRESLIEDMRRYAAPDGPAEAALVWLVFDGPGISGREYGRLRVSYTGGEGPQRADRLILDYLRALRLSGAVASPALVTSDAALAAGAARLGAAVTGAREFAAAIGGAQ